MIEHGGSAIVPGLASYIWLLSGGVAIVLAIVFRGKGPRVSFPLMALAVLAVLFLPKLGLFPLLFPERMARASIIYVGRDPLAMILMAPALHASLITILKYFADRGPALRRLFRL
ncbi:hypothetical protein ACHFJ0_00455 [Paracoccus sp. NGMCC 1.201697]|uniref:Uncharacterized protein n=1 Tax=Paracoccus broussonetiae subsp. drimophilus TaxID=3373869 RepID=A0ABW7LH89_9RHOB